MTGDIICGDCLDIMETMDSDSVDLVITDPPYIVPATTHDSWSDKYHRSVADLSVLEQHFRNYFHALKRIAKPDATYYTFCNADSYPVFYRASMETTRLSRALVWCKPTVLLGHTWRHQHELILWNSRERTRPIQTSDGDLLMHAPPPGNTRLHPVQKPLMLLRQLISKHQNAKVVFDPFCGSGSTLVAAHQLGRQYIGIELDEKYHAIATRRLQDTKQQIQFTAPQNTLDGVT